MLEFQQFPCKNRSRIIVHEIYYDTKRIADDDLQASFASL